MNYGTAEEEIAQRLNDVFTELGVSNLYEAAAVPDNEKAASDFYNQITKALVSVEYIDSNYDPDGGNDAANIVERAKFKLTFAGRKRRGSGGVYTLMELTKKYLIGFKPSNADRLTAVRFERHITEENGIQFSLDFECRTLNAEFEPQLIIPDPALEPGAVYKEMEVQEEFIFTE